MTPASLRIRLALALGLPLAPACKASPSTEPMTPDRTAPTTTTPATTATPPTTTTPPTTPTTTASSGSTCAPDHVHEHVCGLISTSYEGGGGQASAPYEHCTLNALPLWDLDTRHVIDGWKLGSHDAVLAEFVFDAPGTAAFEYELSYRILAWALRVGDASLRARVADELATVRRELEREPTVGAAHRDHDETTGLLAPRTAAQVRRRVLADVVVPCTDALLASHA
jgi:hypothetical protein